MEQNVELLTEHDRAKMKFLNTITGYWAKYDVQKQTMRSI
jgi:hypothetical protein